MQTVFCHTDQPRHNPVLYKPSCRDTVVVLEKDDRDPATASSDRESFSGVIVHSTDDFLLGAQGKATQKIIIAFDGSDESKNLHFFFVPQMKAWYMAIEAGPPEQKRFVAIFGTSYTIEPLILQ